jgi:hypothetical protein
VNTVELNKSQYYDKLLEYYYDNVHWDEPGPPSIYEWAEREYGATISRYQNWIIFDKPEDATFFTLVWA